MIVSKAKLTSPGCWLRIYHTYVRAVFIYSSNSWQKRDYVYFSKCQTILLIGQRGRKEGYRTENS